MNCTPMFTDITGRDMSGKSQLPHLAYIVINITRRLSARVPAGLPATQLSTRVRGGPGSARSIVRGGAAPASWLPRPASSVENVRECGRIRGESGVAGTRA